MRVLSADVGKVKGKLDRYFSRCVGAGRAAEVMRHVAYEQLATIQKEFPFDYIRFHGLFHDEMAVVTRDKEGNLQFNFQYVDLLFDSLLAIHIRPVVELGLMPEALASKDTHVFWWKMNTSPAKDIEEWYALVEALVRHLTHRYGEEEIKKWYFEVWNEPNLGSFFSESKDANAYLTLYEAAARAIKAVCADYKVGGPASAGFYWIDEIIALHKEKDVPLDFVTTHQYCIKYAFDPNGDAQAKMCPKEYLTNPIRRWGERCQKDGLGLLMTEWSASSSSRDPVHDSYFMAPFILDAVKRCEGKVEMMSYWAYTDIFEEVAPPPSLFHGGFGLFTVRSVPKPSYYAYRFLGALGDTELCCEDEACYACRTEKEVQILLWNCVDP
ncbi:MAG: AraC family transcriptional regulator, partial [Clostridia bacterium]|nr:AraC family transcriptional regulator [Clostridia bacterium]